MGKTRYKAHYMWARAEARDLARFVCTNLPEPLRLPASINRLDILHAEGVTGLIGRIYEHLCQQQIRYELAPYNPDAGPTQLIRSPATVLHEQCGTCLDLAVLFASLCLEKDLLPLIVLVEGHVFLGISLTRTRRAKRKPPKALAFDQGLLRDPHVLAELASTEYLIVECTGFAESRSLSCDYPEGCGRDDTGRMSFQRACEAGLEQITSHVRGAAEGLAQGKREFLYALDIYDLQENWGFEPIDPTEPGPLIPLVWRIAAVVVVLLGLITAGMQLYPVIAKIIIPPPKMVGDLKIAVARFGAIDETGKVVQLDAADTLATSTYAFLTDELQQLEKDNFTIAIREPLEVGAIEGATPEMRAASMDTLAEAINADIVVYGIFQSENDIMVLSPEFYVRPQSLPDLEELAGSYPLGSSIRQPGTAANPAATKALSDAVRARTAVLAQFLVGLGYFQLEDFDEAAHYFEVVKDSMAWPEADGKEVVYLFLGHTAGQRQDWLTAEAYYDKALEVDGTFARARLAKGEVLYHQARGETCEPGAVNMAGLEAAIAQYRRALEVPAPPQSNIVAKTNFLVGRGYSCMARAGVDRREDARRALQMVITEYEGGNQTIAELAAQAHDNLGLVYLTFFPEDTDEQRIERYRAASKEYEAAIALSKQPGRQASCYLSLCFIYLGLNDCDAAAEAWAGALEKHKFVPGPDPDYDAWHDKVEALWDESACTPPDPLLK